MASVYTFLSPTPGRRLPKPYTWHTTQPYTWQALVRHPARKKRPREADDPLLSPPWRQPRGKWMVSLVNSHTNATRIGWHLWAIDSRFAPGWPSRLSPKPQTWQALVRHPKKREREAQDPLLSFDTRADGQCVYLAKP